MISVIVAVVVVAVVVVVVVVRIFFLCLALITGLKHILPLK